MTLFIIIKCQILNNIKVVILLKARPYLFDARNSISLAKTTFLAN